MKKKKLIITESPTKARALANSINEKKEFKIVSCYGRLLELNPISPDSFLQSEEIKWHAINPKNLAYIEKSAGSCDEVFIATDPDIEGEVIAWQLAKLFEHIGLPESKVSRITIDSFTKEGIERSLKDASEISFEKAQSGITRRIFDNFSQFTLSDEAIKKHPYIQGSSSRISAPLLKSISDEPLKTHTIKYQREGMPLPAYLEVNSEQDYERVKRQLDRLPSPVFSKIEKKEQRREPQGLDFKGLLSKSKELTNAPQNDIYDSLQNLYVRGKISYFRTDCQELSPDHQKHISSELKGEGATNVKFPRRDVDYQTNNAQEGHSAISPLSPIGNALSNFSDLDLEDKLLSIIWRHWILNSQDRTLYTKTGILEKNAFENIKWKDMEKEFNLKFHEQEISNQFGKRMVFDEALKPLGVLRPLSDKERNLRSIKHSKEEALIERLIKNELARPSTLVYHSNKIGSKFIDSNNRLNARGVSAIIENSKIGNRLLEIEVAQNIERSLHTLHSDLDSDKVLRRSLEESGLKAENPSEKKASRKRSHQISWGGIGV